MSVFELPIKDNGIDVFSNSWKVKGPIWSQPHSKFHQAGLFLFEEYHNPPLEKEYSISLSPYTRRKRYSKNPRVFKFKTEEDSSKKISLIKTILSFKSLEQNWDGYGAIPVEIESAANMLTLIDLIGVDLISKGDLFPNPHGTISIEWSNKKNETLSLEIGNEYMNCFCNMNNQEIILMDHIELTNYNQIADIKDNIEMVAGTYNP